MTRGLTFNAGDRFDVALESRIEAPTLIHWHGFTPPWHQDGVPNNPAAMLEPGETRRYGFPVGKGGTLHGHHFQVVAVNGARFSGAVRDTLLLPPMATVTVAFDADNAGHWPLHCHHLYHMATGMMTTVAYAR